MRKHIPFCIFFMSLATFGMEGGNSSLHERDSDAHQESPAAAGDLRQELERAALALPLRMAPTWRQYLPAGSKATSPEHALILHCGTIFREGDMVSCVLRCMLREVTGKCRIAASEKVHIAERVYYRVCIFPVHSGNAVASDILSPAGVQVWLDVTSSNPPISPDERDKALRRASELDRAMMDILANVTDSPTAERAAEQIKPLVSEFEKQMNAVVLGTPDGEFWKLSPSHPERLQILNRMWAHRFYGSSELLKLCQQVSACFVVE